MMPFPPECLPTFLRRLLAPQVKTILLGGCGGGFDFLHAMALVPLLRSAGKQVVIHSFSFGDPQRISDSPVVFEEGDAVVKQVTGRSRPDSTYGPEVHLCSFLDGRFSTTAPHTAYASYARAFTVPALTRLLRWIVAEHQVDAVLLVDGGSDSLMRGDEEGLGDPVEDAVSVAALASLEGLETKVIACVGLGTDRFNHVSDAATLRAIAELTASGGFLGTYSLEPGSEALTFYEALLQHVYERQSFRSVLAGAIATAARGGFAGAPIDPRFVGRTRPGEVYLWPLMAMFYAFDAGVVAERSFIVQWIRECATVEDCYAALARERRRVPRRAVEQLPRHEDHRNPHGRFL